MNDSFSCRAPSCALLSPRVFCQHLEFSRLICRLSFSTLQGFLHLRAAHLIQPSFSIQSNFITIKALTFCHPGHLLHLVSSSPFFILVVLSSISSSVRPATANFPIQDNESVRVVRRWRTRDPVPRVGVAAAARE